MPSPAVIVGYDRTPFHFAKKGALAGMRPDDLAAEALRALVARSGIDPEHIEDVIMGCAYPEAAQGSNVARIAALLAGLPLATAGVTVNRFCGSSMSAIHLAAGQIALGAGDVFVCGGVESMTYVPQGGFNASPNPRFGESGMPEAYIAMGATAENVARRYGLSREQQDAFGLRSQQKAAAALEAGRLDDELTPISTDQAVIAVDGCLRPGTSLEALAGLKPAFQTDGTVTAGTSSPLTDGAAMTLVCSEAYAEKTGLEPMARVKAVASAGCPPEIMGMGPVAAVEKALRRAHLSIEDIDLVEINEAFASQAIACLQELRIPEEKVNLDGGAIALGHPLGATGARITGKAAQLLRRTKGRYALSTQCVGGGQGVATILEAI